MIHTHRLPVKVGSMVGVIEVSVMAGLRLENSIDSRRVEIMFPATWKSVQIPIQAMETLALWWLNNGPIPSEEITRMRDKESDIQDRP